MLRFLKRGNKSTPEQATDTQASTEVNNTDSVCEAETISEEKPTGFFQRLSGKLSKTGSSLGDGLGRLLLGKKEIDDELLEEIETQLLMSDVGIDTTTGIMKKLAEGIEREALLNSDALYDQLKVELAATLSPSDEPFVVDCTQSPFVILVVGVNGAGKTTTIGKLAKRFQQEGLSVMLAAGDTYRAAAVEQLQVWGERNDVPVIAQHTGADSASVIFDALQSAKSKGADVLIADTAGRLHNKDNLMEELKKVVRVMGKIDAAAPQEILLVLDATTGQNAVAQAEQFKAIVGVTGLAITKLDGTAKGGVLFAISEKLQLPIRFIGVGEQVDDLRPFNADEFVNAIFDDADA
jgi:fused signal recognition particle receptor